MFKMFVVEIDENFLPAIREVEIRDIKPGWQPVCVVDNRVFFCVRNIDPESAKKYIQFLLVNND